MKPQGAVKQTRSACDRCYALKERCQRPSTTATAQASHACTRCERLSLVCETKRPVKRPGRPAASSYDGTQGTRSLRAAGRLHMHRLLERLPLLSTQERLLLQSAFADAQQTSAGPRTSAFNPITILHQLVPTADDASMVLVKDALLAYATAVRQSPRSKSHARITHSSDNVTTHARAMTQNDSITYIARAMASLRTLSVTSAEDAALCYAVGSLIALSVYAAVGLGVSRVCRYCLGATSSFVVSSPRVKSMGGGRGLRQDETSSPSGGRGGGDDSDDERRPLEGFMMLMEITDCIFYQRAPTSLHIMLGPGRPASQLEALISRPSANTDSTSTARPIDSHLGLCLPLLPYYHRLCTISNILAQSTTTPDQQSELFLQLETIHKAIEPWQPPNLSDLLGFSASSCSTTIETLHLLSQAKLYRLGILLFAHRLRYPFDIDPTQDICADIWASEVFHELSTTVTVTGQAMRFVTLPLIMAGVEMRSLESRERALRAVDEGVDGENVARALKEGVKQFLVKIWEERDARRMVVDGAGMKWFESVNKPCPIVESVYEELGVMEVGSVC